MKGHVWLIDPEGNHIGWVLREDAEEMAARQDVDVIRGQKVWSMIRRKPSAGPSTV